MNENIKLLEDAVVDRLREVIDPELSVNIWDLGLVYDLQVENQKGLTVAVITMTLTSAACPLSDMIEAEVANQLDGVVDGFRINWVWMPPWSPGRVSDEGREMLRAVGFNL